MSERTKADIISDINTVIEKYVLPAVGSHGGAVKLVDFDTLTGVLKLQMGEQSLRYTICFADIDG